MRTDFHLVVIGGGMVGACVAALAAADRRLGELRIAILEPRAPSTPPPLGDRAEVALRVSAVSRASERILASVGAWQQLPGQHVCAYDEMVVWDKAGPPRGPGSIRFSASATSEPNLGYIIENRRLQWALYECAPLRDRVTVLRAELVGMDFEPEQVALSLADGRRITAMLVVGSDGAASASRRLAGIDTDGWDYEQHAFVTHVRTAHPHAYTAWQRFLPAGPIAFLPLADGRSSIVWSTRPDHAQELVDCAPQDAARQIEAAIDGVLGGIQVAGPRGSFPLRLTHARHYCKERFVLVGDAAHAVHPLAGQGVNLGFLDCAALVQILAQAMAGGARPEALGEMRVLRRYERWRRSENALALGFIDGMNRIFSSANPVLAVARRIGLTAVDRNAPAKRFLMDRALGIRGEIPHIASRSTWQS